MRVAVIKCNVCGEVKGEADEWLVAYVSDKPARITCVNSPYKDGISGSVCEDICSYVCLQERMERIFESIQERSKADANQAVLKEHVLNVDTSPAGRRFVCSCGWESPYYAADGMPSPVMDELIKQHCRRTSFAVGVKPDSTNEHKLATKVEADGSSRYVCSCGWEGSFNRALNKMRDEAKEHLSIVSWATNTVTARMDSFDSPTGYVPVSQVTPDMPREPLTAEHSTEHYRITEWVKPTADSPYHKFFTDGPGVGNKCYIALGESCGPHLIKSLEAAWQAGYEDHRNQIKGMVAKGIPVA